MPASAFLIKVDVFNVLGAFEMPLDGYDLASTGKYSAIAATSFAIDGDLMHLGHDP